jgi:hypothetical protein
MAIFSFLSTFNASSMCGIQKKYQLFFNNHATAKKTLQQVHHHVSSHKNDFIINLDYLFYSKYYTFTVCSRATTFTRDSRSYRSSANYLWYLMIRNIKESHLLFNFFLRKSLVFQYKTEGVFIYFYGQI